METNNITAIVIDSGITVSDKVRNMKNLFTLPLRINFSDKEYIDGVNITIEEIIPKIKEYPSKTTLPLGSDIVDILNIIKEKGYKNVVFITISSSLSGCYSMIKNFLSEYKMNYDMSFRVIDSKNISIGSGLIVNDVFEILKENNDNIDDLMIKIDDSIENTKLFFTVSDISYLKRGGRINKFIALLSDLFNIKPIISCNNEGEYILYDKARGKNKAYEKIINNIEKYLKKYKNSKLFLVYGEDKKELKVFMDMLKQKGIELNEYYVSQVSCSLITHTGPKALGVSIRLLK